MKNGYQNLIEDKPLNALEEFTKAKNYFLEAGNVMEATAISQHFIAYTLYNMNRREEAIKLFGEVELFCKRNNYKWLNLSNEYWITGWKANALDFHTTRNAKELYQNGLKTAEELDDIYFQQKYLLTLAERSYKLRQKDEMLFYLQKLFNLSSGNNISFRQKFRNYTTSLKMLIASDFKEIAKEIAKEEVSLANLSKDKYYIAKSEIDTAFVQMQIENFQKAEEWLSDARKTVESMNEESQKKDLMAEILLKLGDIEVKQANYQKAADYFDESLQIVQTQKSPVLLYEISKSRLFAYQELGKKEEVGNQIPKVIEIAEKYRSEIVEEQERNSFFAEEQNIYDLAIEYELSNGNQQKAFDYAEISSSRSLLDWLKKGITKPDKSNEILLTESTTPYNIEDIQSRMPSEVQILQYTVLEKKVLLWSVSKESVNVVTVDINQQDLNQKIEQYLSLIQSSEVEKQGEAKQLGRELYSFLINPILPYLDKNKEICLIPNKSLFQLPFSSLISLDEKYFIADFNFFYAPSANVFLLATQNAQQKEHQTSEKLLSVGNPNFSKEDFAELDDLPQAKEEAQDIAQYYTDSKILLEKEATKRNIQQIYKDSDVIHFAGHYIVQHNLPLLSGLVLAKDNDSGILTNYELSGENLSKTKLAILSACRTGTEKYYQGEGLIGLSRTFLASGVPLVIASQWEVDSKATAKLMKRFHYYRKEKNFSSSNALRQAQLEMLNSEEEGFSSPYYWAAFASFGGYAKF